MLKHCYGCYVVESLSYVKNQKFKVRNDYSARALSLLMVPPSLFSCLCLSVRMIASSFFSRLFHINIVVKLNSLILIPKTIFNNIENSKLTWISNTLENSGIEFI